MYIISDEDLTRIIARRGSFYIARIAAYLWRGTDDWKQERSTLQAQLKELQDGTLDLAELFNQAFDVLRNVVGGSDEYASDVDRALKSSALDKDIDKTLHAQG